MFDDWKVAPLKIASQETPRDTQNHILASLSAGHARTWARLHHCHAATVGVREPAVFDPCHWKLQIPVTLEKSPADAGPLSYWMSFWTSWKWTMRSCSTYNIRPWLKRLGWDGDRGCGGIPATQAMLKRMQRVKMCGSHRQYRLVWSIQHNTAIFHSIVIHHEIMCIHMYIHIIYIYIWTYGHEVLTILTFRSISIEACAKSRPRSLRRFRRIPWIRMNWTMCQGRGFQKKLGEKDTRYDDYVYLYIYICMYMYKHI